MKEKLFTLTKKDFEVEFFRGSGKGGQHRNKTDSCCRITHEASGASAIGTEHREQSKNKALAFKRLTENIKFKLWITKKINNAFTDKEIEEYVDEQMKEENLKVVYLKGDLI